MLGDQALFAEPHLLRRQEIACYGEPLYLRFGLMHEDHASRIALVAALYATGLLAAVDTTQNYILLRLREPVQRASDFRVWVWERGKITPRCLDPLEAELLDETTLYVLRESIVEPLGWLLSWDGVWRGARFHVEPGATAWKNISEGWSQVIEHTRDWGKTAQALRAWHFPVLMPPFYELVLKRAILDRFSTMDAWVRTGPLLTDAGDAHVDGDPAGYAAPIRELLPPLCAAEQVPREFANEHVTAVLGLDWLNHLYEPASDLLRAQPVLLAQLLVSIIKTEFTRREKMVKVVPGVDLFHKQRDPKQMAELRKSTELVTKVVIEHLHAYAGVPGPANRPDDLSLLQTAALNGLRSWADKSAVDSKFFKECVAEPADQLFRGENAQTKWLRLTIARSSACCAFLAAHLVYRHLYLELKNGTL